MNSWTYITIGAATVVVLGAGAWFIFFSGGTDAPPVNLPSLGTGQNQTNTSGSGTSQGEESTLPVQLSAQKIFQIAQGPVAGAVFIQTNRPTTTVARYVSAENGHVFDLVIDSQGSIAKALSNTTIPGVQRVVWTQNGDGAVLQYLDNETIKTALLRFPTATTSRAVKIQFLPDNVIDVAASPDGRTLAYLLRTSAGVDGYTVLSDGTGAKKIFSLPLSQMRISWPSQGTLLLQTNPAAGVPGMSFSVDSKSGAVSPLLYAEGLTATADRTFESVVYQTTLAGGERSSYVYNVKSGGNAGLSFDPYPEKCLWALTATSTLYCAVPLSYVPPSYLDAWRQGTASAADGILSFNVASGRSAVIATPGGSEGGVASDILELGVSPDEKYLFYVTKNSRALWGVRLAQ